MRTLTALALAATLLGAAGAGAATDLHRFWDQTCGDCHGHAADWARKFLTVASDGTLQGRHHKDDLLRFLGNHHVPQDLVVPVYEMLRAQAQTDPRFRTMCGRCHEGAADLARQSLELRDGVLVGRESGRPVADLLPGHAMLRLSPEDTTFFIDLLTRVRLEVAPRG